MVNLFISLEPEVIYNKTNIRDFLKDKCEDSISLPTTRELLNAIIDAQEKGIIFQMGNKMRKLIEKQTINNDTLYELIEFEE